MDKVVRINISISAATKERLDRFNDQRGDLRLNISAVCERALKERLDSLEKASG